MPLYEYECQQCRRYVEKIQKFSDPPLTECSHCGGRLEKTITAPAVQFKGGGWYADLYSSSKKSGGTAKSESSSTSSSDSTSSTPAPAATATSDKK
ncbi:zinc ribbon domain-containing protein [Terriglobus albidus]|uniref:Zinc ribbon domain-containing protein n=1 Tax=Terriglobus albidus TaxID=1592106 RepID=A0A5B9E5X9_9BACT|nr:FmdB family zinc ribbon protein [Terriglobus albidus]QEE27408.1 zinc ribbon domain-containing protein [Terriglobus albidus]